MKKTFLIILSLMLVEVSANALENYGLLNGYQDFSSRSVIMQKLNGENRTTQEQKDILESKGLSPNVKCILEQIKKKNYSNVELLINSNVNINSDYQTVYPIYLASKLNDFEMVKLLHSNGAKLDRSMYSELFEAIKNKNTEMAMFLIENGAKVNYIDSFSSNTALYFAIKNNMLDVASEMIARRAWISPRTLTLINKKKLTNLLEN